MSETDIKKLFKIINDQIPDYEYSRNDFEIIVEHDLVRIKDWKLPFNEPNINEIKDVKIEDTTDIKVKKSSLEKRLSLIESKLKILEDEIFEPI